MDDRRLTPWFFRRGFTVLVLMLFIAGSGCLSTNDSPVGDTSAPVNVVCNPPYIVGGSECCLDQNSNGICDNEESIPPPPAQITAAPATNPPQTQLPTTLPPETSTTQSTSTTTSPETTTTTTSTTSTTTTTTTMSTTTSTTTTSTTASTTTTSIPPYEDKYFCSQGPSGYVWPKVCVPDCPQGTECDALECICK